jgi:hypothetical protein
MNPKDKNSYMGRSAHLAVMSKLAALGYRVTIPEVDVGKDVLAFLDTKPNVIGVQVKSTECKRLKAAGAFSGLIDVPEAQLSFGGDLYYVFVFGLDGEWVDYLIISREKLYDLRVSEGIGTVYIKGKKKHLKFTFSFSKAGVKCGAVPFSDYRNSWEKLPHAAEGGGELAGRIAGRVRSLQCARNAVFLLAA